MYVCEATSKYVPGEARFVDIGGRTLHAKVSGAGPTVVLNSGAGREGVGSWSAIEARLSEFATVVTYDRAGVGQSPAPLQPPTVRDMADDLGQLLDKLAVSRPLVLVGHSMAGLLVQLFACEHPAHIAGLVLLDPTPDEFLAGLRNLPPAARESMRSATIENARRAGASDACALELRRIFESCQQVRRAVVDEKKMPDVAVVVVTACMPEQVFGKSVAGATMTQAHRRIAERGPRGRHVLAERSSHRTLISQEPDLIVETIRSMFR